MADKVFPETDDDITEPILTRWLGRGNITGFVKSGLTLSPDYTVPDVNVASGTAYITDGTKEYYVEADARTGISLTDSAVNYVFLAINTSSDDSLYYDVDTNNTPPSDPSILLGKVDTTNDTKTPLGRTPDAEFSEINGTFRVAGSPRTGERIQHYLDTLKSRGGGKLKIGPGQWTIDSTLSVDQEIVMEGTGLETELYLGAGADTNLIEITNGSNWTSIRDMFITGNKANNTAGTGILLGEDCYGCSFENLIISKFVEDGFAGVQGGSTPALEPNMVNVYSQYNDLNGFHIVNTGDLSAYNIYAEGNGEQGIIDKTGFNAYFHPHGYDNTKNGMSIFGDESIVIGGHMETNQRRGLQIKGSYNNIIGTLFYRNSQGSTGTYDSIQCDGSSQTLLTGIVSMDTQSTTTTRYLFTDVNGANRTHVMNHTVQGHTPLPPISQMGTETTVNGWGREDLGVAPTSQPQGAYRHGDMIWNQNSDNDEMWVRVPDGSYKPLNTKTTVE